MTKGERNGLLIASGLLIAAIVIVRKVKDNNRPKPQIRESAPDVAQSIIGLPEAAAVEIINNSGYSPRRMSSGEIGSMDYRLNRINYAMGPLPPCQANIPCPPQTIVKAWVG